MFVDIYRGLVLSGVCHTHKGCIVCITRYAYKYLSSYLEHKSEYGTVQSMIEIFVNPDENVLKMILVHTEMHKR